MGIRKDLVGKTFGRITVLELVGSDTKGQSVWKCKCSCGTVWNVSRGNLGRSTTSCGCRKREVTGELHRLPYGEAASNALYDTYKRDKRHLEFSLSKEEFLQLTKKPCHYCGTEPLQVYFNSRSTTPYIYNGVDRVQNKIGYLSTNVVPCCTICNRAKRSMSLEEFLAWIDRLVKFRTQQNPEGPAKRRGKN